MISRTLSLDAKARNAGLYWVASPARAVVDACRDLRDLRTVRAVVAEAVQRGFTDLPTLSEEITRAKRSRTALVRKAFQEVLDGVRAGAEAELHECMSSSPVGALLVWNPQLSTPDGQRLPTPDAWIPDSAVAVEVDSQEFHFTADGWRKTIDRHNEMTRHGVLVIHLTPAEVRDDPARVRRIIEDAHAARAGMGGTCGVLTGAPSYA